MWNIRPLIFIFIFFPDSPTEVTRAWNITRDGLKHALWRKCLFGVHKMADNILGFKFPKNRGKCKHVRASANGLKTNDVIEDWRHWLRYVAACRRGPLCRGRAAYTINSIWVITAAVYFQVIKHYIRHGNSVLASVYSICRQSVVQGVA